MKFFQRIRRDPDSGWKAKEKGAGLLDIDSFDDVIGALIIITEIASNPIYKLLDHNMGGLLVRLFESEGAFGLQRWCCNTLQSQYLYDCGYGSIIEHDDYAYWRQETDEKLSGQTQSRTVLDIGTDYTQDRFVQFRPHKACWDLNKRGVLGETLLHLCYYNDTPIHAEIAKILIETCPLLTLDIMEGPEYYGQSALHMAVVNGDLESVKLLVQNGAYVNQRVTGRFFLPEDQKIKQKKRTNYVGYAYYGEYPLAFAACFGHESIYDFLVNNGADPNLQDSFGNTVLHMIVINNQLDMYSYASRHPTKPQANTWIKNGLTNTHGEGLTPLALACKLGRHEIFKEIMELHRIELWRYSNICCSLFPLHAIDSIGIGGRTNWNSAVMIIVNGETDDHLEMLQGGVIRQLLDEKWKTFVSKRFFMQLAFIIIHLLFLSCAIYLRPDHDLTSYHSTKDAIRFGCEIIVVIMCFIQIMLQINEMKSQGLVRFVTNLANAPSKPLFLISVLMVICCLPVRILQFISTDEAYLANLQKIEETMLIVATPCGWCLLLFFAKGHGLTGQSVMMFYKIIAGDMFRFIVMFSIFLVGFTQVFHFLARDTPPGPDGKELTSFVSPHGSVMDLLHMTLGDFTYEEFYRTRYPELTQLVFALFMIFMPILLINMLIAMMGNTYMNTLAKSEPEWIRQWAKIVLVLERNFQSSQLLKFQQDYSVPVDTPPAADAEYLRTESREGEALQYTALMVIKATAKTSAKQRRGAISNWRWMLKETLSLIRSKRSAGYTGEIDYKVLFPEKTEFMAYESAVNKNKHQSGSFKKRGSAMFGDVDGGDWTHAVEQLAWEKDLDLTGASKIINTDPSPLDQVDSPPDSYAHIADEGSGPGTELTTMDYDDELEAIIQAHGVIQESSSYNPVTTRHRTPSATNIKVKPPSPS